MRCGPPVQMVMPAYGDEVLLVVRSLLAHHRLVFDVIQGESAPADVHGGVKEAGDTSVSTLYPLLP